MKLSKAHLKKDLDEQLKGIYSFFAEESIQISELADLVIEKAKLESFEEKQTHIISKDTDWSFLQYENENLDLFGSKKTQIKKNLKLRKNYNKLIFEKLRKIQLPLEYKKKKSNFIIKNNFKKFTIVKKIKFIKKKILGYERNSS